MSLKAMGGLSIQEVQRLESRLVAQGYRAVDESAWEIGNNEYSVGRYPERDGSRRHNEKYSICWRN